MDDMPDQEGRTVLVTGANDGLGYHLTKAFAQKGANVLMACRTIEKAEAVKTEISELYQDASLQIVPLDLGDLQSVRQCADMVLGNNSRLDCIMCNAGIMAVPYGTTKDGLEKQMGVNYYGHYALVGHLLPVIKQSPGTRIVTTSSGGEKMGKLDLDNPPTEENYHRWQRYGDSKLAVLMFALMLDEKFKESGVDAKGLSAHPGFARTNLRTRRMESEKNLFQLFLLWLFEKMSMSGERGALPLLCAATHPTLQGGEYIGVSGIGEIHGSPKITTGQKRTYDPDLRKQLWQKSEELTGVTYRF